MTFSLQGLRAGDGVEFRYDLPGNLIASMTATSNAPSLLMPPTRVIGTIGGAGGFSAVVSGPGAMSYQWYFNGTAIAGATGDSLRLSPLAEQQAGNYTVVISNAFGAITNGPYTLDFDRDHDGLPDLWEAGYFGNTQAQSGSGDFDGDGVSNLDEYRDGTNPTDAHSVFPRLVLNGIQCSVAASPDLPQYGYGQAVTIAATPAPGLVFLGWSGDFEGAGNPATVTLDRTKKITGRCGLPLGSALDCQSLPWLAGGMGWYGQTNETADGVDAGQSAPIGPSQQSWVSTAVNNTKMIQLDYWWREANMHWLKFYVNGILYEQNSTVEWQKRSLLLLPGTNVLQWVYSWNPALGQNKNAQSDAAWLDQVVVSNFFTVPLGAALDLPDRPWNTGRIPWFGETNVAHTGISAAQSGPVTRGQQTWLELTNVWNADGILSFWWKVNSAPDEDYTRFFINGMKQAEMSGAVDWQRLRFVVGAGTNVLRWEFSKHSNTGSRVDDGAWLDGVTLTPYADPDLDLDHNYLPDLSEFLFRGGTGDGFVASTLANVALSGEVAGLEPYLGGAGDGFAAQSLFNVSLTAAGTETTGLPNLGSSGDGYSSAGLFNVALDSSLPEAVVFTGSIGDGFSSSALYNSRLDLLAEVEQPGIFLGGVGDGFDADATDVANVPLDGPAGTSEAAWFGGVGDGFTAAAVFNLSLGDGSGAPPPEIFAGGQGDGFDASLLSGVSFQFLGKDVGLYVDNAAVSEIGMLPTNVAFTVRLSSATWRPISAEFATSDLTATAGVDYVAASGFVAFQPGETNKQITVATLGHIGTVPARTFALRLFNPVNVSFGRPEAVGTILGGSQDSDGDGIPDWWMLSYFGHGAGQAQDYSRAQDDADGDGMSNLAEYQADTNPLDPGSLLRFNAISLVAPGSIRVNWQGGIQATQFFQVRVPAGGAWANYFTNLPPTPVTNQFIHAAGTNSTLWYRIFVPGRR